MLTATTRWCSSPTWPILPPLAGWPSRRRRWRRERGPCSGSRCGWARSASGALNLYRDRPGPLSDGQHADALVMADVAARWVLEVQAGAPPGGLARELEVGADFRFVVHNAAGMVAVQLGVSVSEALIHLRAYAFSHDRLLRDVAQDVVDRTLRFS